MILKHVIAAILVVTFITACGGSDDVSVRQGVFKDSGNTVGISYVSGQETGITGEDGSFKYEVGEPVIFSIGKVVLGETAGKAIIRPVDLVPNGHFDSIQVQNIMRFLMMLDEDSSPNTGITISKNVQVVAKTWPSIDFTSQRFEDDLITLIADVVSIEEKEHSLPSAATAKAHLKSAFLCAYAGAYQGDFSGGDKGNFSAFVNALTGEVTGLAVSTTSQQFIKVTSNTPIDHDNQMAFVAGTTSSNAVFKGSFSSTDHVEGTWTNNTLAGNFSGHRIGADATASYRFTAIYQGSDNGLFIFNMDTNNRITGVAYSLSDGKQVTVTGQLTQNQFTASTQDGSTMTGTINSETGIVKGGWINTQKNVFGLLSGTGCRLN
ncbi:MAG: hypothetical protein KAG20_03190 [Cocleimonas sp.]|nr:hypothetical protein [Cocleimonas sp.]